MSDLNNLAVLMYATTMKFPVIAPTSLPEFPKKGDRIVHSLPRIVDGGGAVYSEIEQLVINTNRDKLNIKTLYSEYDELLKEAKM